MCIRDSSLPYTEEDFSVYGLERDMIVPEDIAWTHRRGELEMCIRDRLSTQLRKQCKKEKISR